MRLGGVIMKDFMCKKPALLLLLFSAMFVLSIMSPSEAVSASTGFTIWPSTAAPVVTADPDTSPIELGLKFRADSSGSITGIRFYKAITNTGTHTGSLWTSGGTLLARATFAGEAASGWQQADFTAPVAITANTVYVASYHTNAGRYSDDPNYFTSKGVDNAPLHALAAGVSGANGVYAYGPASVFPNQDWNSSNYWVDVVFSTSVTPDTTPPTVTAFSIPATATSLTVVINSFTATDSVGVTGYVVTESAAIPSAADAGWSSTQPAFYSFTSAGSKTLYAWAKDAAGNVSGSRNSSVTISLADVSPPTVDTFVISSTSSSLTVAITSFKTTDNVAVTGYMVSESAATPSLSAAGWSSTMPASYTFTSAGTKTLYAWVRDAAGNLSVSKKATVTITILAAVPEPDGWYAGDMHVHRSCGGAPETVSSLYGKMAANNLSVISLLADMGNGELQTPATDLPLVDGRDASVSTSGRIVHWDAEWHWDPTYPQYPHQALGGHIVALGLTQAFQVWDEYTYPIFDWVHQRSGIAGFVHMQYLDDTNTIPNGLTCCTPMEYPVEVALGTTDFISEDVADCNSTCGGAAGPGASAPLCPDCFIHAYYKLLNCGFRPGFAGGTDYPCNCGDPVGSILTYSQVDGGQMTYGNWINAIKNGRTVVSRNGHNEFLNLTVNGTATPGDEINLTGAGSVQVNIQWTAIQSLTGSLELVQNGVVVASRQASVSQGAPATLSTMVNFTKSGWLTARRMGSNGHMVHTAAVFVMVNSAPVRASAADAQFYVKWMDNLITKTSSGGVWSSFFPKERSAAQARYQAAKVLYQKIASEAGTVDTAPPSVSITSPGNGTTVSGAITVTANATDDVGVTKVEFYLDGALQATDIISPYTWSWNSGLTSNGSHTITAKAYDAAGNSTASSAVNITNSNSIALVQKASSITASAQNLTAALSSNATAGNFIVVSVSGWPNLPAATAVTDNLGNIYSIAGTVLVSQGAYSAIYYAKNVIGGAVTVTVNTVKSGGQISMTVAEFSGIDTVLPLDATAGSTGSGTTPSSGNMTPTLAGNLLIGSGTHNGNAVTGAGAGFTMIAVATEDSNTHQPLAMEYQVLSGNQQTSTSFSLSTGYGWAQNGAIFKHK